MKITIESTGTISDVDNVPVRLWVGESESGVKVEAYIAAITIDENEPRAYEFLKELIESKPLKLKPL